jgi:hypothetical protein
MHGIDRGPLDQLGQRRSAERTWMPFCQVGSAVQRRVNDADYPNTGYGAENSGMKRSCAPAADNGDPAPCPDFVGVANACGTAWVRAARKFRF